MAREKVRQVPYELVFDVFYFADRHTGHDTRSRDGVLAMAADTGFLEDVAAVVNSGDLYATGLDPRNHGYVDVLPVTSGELGSVLNVLGEKELTAEDFCQTRAPAEQK